MKTKNTIAFLCMLTALQACSQKTLQPFEKKSYPFPIPTTEQPRKTMKELAEQQAEEVKKLLADPYDGGTKLTVDLRRIGDSEWCYPLPGAKVISNYGGRDGRQHTGVDLKTRPNDSILAVFDGIVIMSAPFSAYGNCIILAHENGLQTLYSHNVKNLVKEGDFVKVGQPIALTGRTGRATTEHLHFEVRVAGKNYNPNILFEHNTRKLQKHKLVFSKNGGVSIKK